MEKPIGYQEYREMLGLAKQKKVNVENVRKKANEALEDFKKAILEGGN
jgi:ribosome recycling factor